MSIKLVKVNDHKVKKIPIKIDTRKVKGSELCPDLYSNIFLVASTNSGKSTVIWDIINNCVGKKTQVIAFCSTLFNDENWVYIRKELDKRDIYFEGHESIIDDDGNNILKDLVKMLGAKAAAEENEDSEEEENVFDTLKRLTEPKKNESKPKKTKYASPEYLIIFDDMSEELKTTTYTTLLKHARHYKIKTITSSQDLKDLKPSGRDQIRLFLIFGGQTYERLENLYNSLKLNFSFDLFNALYKNATEPTVDNPKPFLYIDTRREIFRKSFYAQFIIPRDMK